MSHPGRFLASLVLVLVGLLATPSPSSGEDTIEFLSGVQSRGTVLNIDKNQRKITFESRVGDRDFQRIYPYSKIHAVTYRGKRYVINKMAPVSANTNEPIRRSKQEVLDVISSVGSSPPDWFDTTPLEYPDTLDLSWPKKPEGQWNNQKNIGQYLWDVINPNQSKWRSGVRLIHHMVDFHQNDKEKHRRAMRTLGGMYFRLFQDYARSAYWWQKSGISGADREALAECYWRLGNKRMALDTLDPQRVRAETIKLLGDMGETRRAIQLAELFARNVKEPHWGLLAAGDACRLDGQYKQAIGYYQRVLNAGQIRNEDYSRRARDRARQSIDAIRQFELLDIGKVPDGSYVAESMGYEGPVEVTVTMNSGRIDEVQITKHKEKQYYSALRDVPQQIIAKQSLKNVDATSRATITAEAIISATAKALTQDEASTGGRRPRAFR